jgi:aspartate kinase
LHSDAELLAEFYGAEADFIPHHREKYMSRSSSWSERTVVIKLGGSILVSPKAYKRAALFVRNRRRGDPGERLVIVVSAQEGATDRLERAAKKIVRKPQAAPLDLLWSTGEIRSVAILALELQALGVQAVPLNIHQAGLKLSQDRNEDLGAHQAVECHSEKLQKALDRCPIAIVPGFFATDSQNAVASLGRGGSDLTAVLLAEGLQACRCELVKDVPGYFSSDPHKDPSARPIAELSFAQALELADGGCDLVQRLAIEAARRSGIPLVIRSLNEKEPVSRIVGTEQNGSWANQIPSVVGAV